MSTVGERIVELRNRRGWSSNYLATLSGVSSGYLSDIEKGKRKNPSGEIIARIAKELDTTVDYLLGRTDDPKPMAPDRQFEPRFNPKMTQVMADLEFRVIPVFGPVTAGSPAFVMEEPNEYIHVPSTFLRSATFAIRVHGDSMIDIDIRDGDVLLVHPQDTADPGDIVVARVDGDCYTIKRLKFRAGRPYLEPANSNYRPIEADDLQIVGKAVKIIREL